MNAHQAFQRRIDLQQDVDAIDYALRSIRLCGRHGCTGPHGAQLVAGCAAAARVLGCEYAEVMHAAGGHNTQLKLRGALTSAREQLKAAKAACGGVRQLRLALGELHDLPLAA